MMPAEPFLILAVRGKKDILVLRQKARLIAHLLRFQPHEQTCIAAGAFAIAQRAWDQQGKARICFQMEQDQLHIFAQDGGTSAQEGPGDTPGTRTEESTTSTSKGLLRLAKPLPHEKGIAEREIAGLVGNLAQAVAGHLFDEIIKQNDEVLNLLHELQVCRDYLKPKEEQPKSPSAA
jgi:hypothetical protein